MNDVQEMRAYISDIAHRLEDVQLLQMLHTRDKTLAQTAMDADGLKSEDHAADTQQKIAAKQQTIENINYLLRQLDNNALKKIYFLVLHIV